MQTDQALNELAYETFAATELQNMQLSPPKMIVPEMLTAGLAILAGTPKAGKSQLMLKLASHIAKGINYLGKELLEPKRVLYLGLEDTPYRLSNRLRGLKCPITNNLVFATAFPKMEEGGIQALHKEIHTNEYELVVIDTLGRFSSGESKGGNAYFADTERGEALQQTAFQADACILVVHHMSKGAKSKADFIQQISGSQGLPGAADVIMGFNRKFNSEVSELHITGRDIKSSTLEMQWSVLSGGWQLCA